MYVAHSFATPSTARVIGPSARRGTPPDTGLSHTGFGYVTFGQNEQVSRSVGSEPSLTKQAFSEANNTQTNNPKKLMKYKPKVVSYGLSVLTATAALIGAGGPL